MGGIFFSCLSNWNSQIAAAIPTIASPTNSPKGKPRSRPFCWSVPEQGKMMYVISHSETCRAVFSLTGKSLFLPGIWHCFLSPAAFHQRWSVGQNRPCKQGGDALQKEKADLRNIWISKVSHLMSWASWSYKAESSITVFSYLASILQPVFSGGREIRITATTTKRKNVCPVLRQWNLWEEIEWCCSTDGGSIKWALPGLKSSVFWCISWFCKLQLPCCIHMHIAFNDA